MSAPRLEVRLDLVEHNARSLVDALGARGIGVMGVTKAVLGCPGVARAMGEGGIRAFGDSRLANVARLRDAGVAAPVTMVRSPMRSEVDQVVARCDTSLNTEASVLGALAAAATAADRIHGIVLMVELGDRREGILPDDLEAIARAAVSLPGLALRGIGTNLACRNGVVPDDVNMAALSRAATLVEAAVGIELSVVSGGNSANLRWALGGGDVGRIDELRIGEALLLGCDPLDRSPIAGLRTEAFRVIGEVIESKLKPSLPEGRCARSAFGSVAPPRERGDIVQSIVAIGRQDVDPDDLDAPDGVTICAASSDHLVVETAEPLVVGSELAFVPGYAALLRAATSPFVAVVRTG